MKIKITRKNLIKEELTKTKIASPECRQRLAGQLYDEEDSLGRKLNPDEKRNIINNFRFDVTNQCTWYPFEPLITTNDEFRHAYKALMSNIGRTGDEAEIRRGQTHLDELVNIVKSANAPAAMESGYMSDMLKLLKGIAKKYKEDYLDYYDFDIEDKSDDAPSTASDNRAMVGTSGIKEAITKKETIMKITRKKLQEIIEEELRIVLESRAPSDDPEDQPRMSRDLKTDPVTEEEVRDMSLEQVEKLISQNRCDRNGRDLEKVGGNLERSCILLKSKAYALNPGRS